MPAEGFFASAVTADIGDPALLFVLLALVLQASELGAEACAIISVALDTDLNGFHVRIGEPFNVIRLRPHTGRNPVVESQMG